MNRVEERGGMGMGRRGYKEGSRGEREVKKRRGVEEKRRRGGEGMNVEWSKGIE